MSAEKSLHVSGLPLTEEIAAAIADYHQSGSVYTFVDRVRAMLGDQGRAVMDQLNAIHPDGYLGTVHQAAGAITLLAVERAMQQREAAEAPTVLIPVVPDEVMIDPAESPLPRLAEAIPPDALGIGVVVET